MEKYSFQIPNVFPTVNKILFKCQKQLQWFTFPVLTVGEHQALPKRNNKPQDLGSEFCWALSPAVWVVRNPFLKMVIYVNCTFKRLDVSLRNILSWRQNNPPLHPDLNQQIIHVTHLARCLNLHIDEASLENAINILIFRSIWTKDAFSSKVITEKLDSLL